MHKMILIALLCVGALWAAPYTRPVAADGGADNQEPKTVLHVYDLRDYLMEPGGYPLDVSKQRPAIRPAHVGLRAEFDLNGGGNAVQIPNPPTQPAAAPDPAMDKLNGLEQLIESQIEPDSWRDAGGSIGTINEIDGKLLVTQTPRAQARVAKLIADITAGANRTLHVGATWLSLTDDQLAAMREPAAKGQNDAVVRLSDAALQKAAPIARAGLLCLDGQTVHITAGPQPMRIALQVQPRLASSDKEVVVDVLNTIADSQEFHTTARLPLGAQVVIGGITGEPAGKDQPTQLYLVIRVDAASKVP